MAPTEVLVQDPCPSGFVYEDSIMAHERVATQTTVTG